MSLFLGFVTFFFNRRFCVIVILKLIFLPFFKIINLFSLSIAEVYYTEKMLAPSFQKHVPRCPYITQ